MVEDIDLDELNGARTLEDAHSVVPMERPEACDWRKHLTHRTTLYMLRICISETAMGVKVGAQTGTESQYVRDVYAVGKYFLERLVRPWLYFDFLYLLTHDGRVFDKHVRGIHGFTKRYGLLLVTDESR